MGVSGLNPKGLLLFLAMLPQFTDPRGSMVGTRAVLGARPAASRVLSRVSGVAKIAVGVALLAERPLTH